LTKITEKESVLIRDSIEECAADRI